MSNDLYMDPDNPDWENNSPAGDALKGQENNVMTEPPPWQPSWQDWVMWLPRMQQSVLDCAIRGPDGFAKYHPCKPLIRFYRRSVKVSAFDGTALNDPIHPGGGSFTGPSLDRKHLSLEDTELSLDDWDVLMEQHVDAFMDCRDEMHLHYYCHFMHAVEIVGYKHPIEQVREFWKAVYYRMVHALHLFPEPMHEMDLRLGDNKEQWLMRSDTSETKRLRNE